VIRGFKRFVSHLPKDGILVVNKEDRNARKITNNKKQKIFFFSIKQPEAKKLKKILKIPGEQNVYDALAALQVARILKIPDKISFQSLSEYQGSWRRFDERDLKIKNKKIRIINDYGHHPTEIKATIIGYERKI
jgi:UDP-N-acetylmuramate--alanine ligase